MTNAEFLNKNFGTNYKGYMRCGWNYTPDILVWMVEFDGLCRRGWENRIRDNGNIITEDFVWSLDKQLERHRDLDGTIRLAVYKSQGYKILGVYKYDEKNSKLRTHRVWVKVADSLADFLNYKK